MGVAMRTYSIIVDPDPEGGFTVTVPALPGCITEGETIEECLAHAEEAIALYIEDLASGALHTSGAQLPDLTGASAGLCLRATGLNPGP